MKPTSPAGRSGRNVGLYRGPVECAWCRKVMRAGDPKLPTSHGLCVDCEAQVRLDRAIAG